MVPPSGMGSMPSLRWSQERVRATRPGYVEWNERKLRTSSPAMYAAMILRWTSAPASELSSRARTEAILKRALADDEAAVRRRAAYVAGNLHAAGLVPALVELPANSRQR